MRKYKYLLAGFILLFLSVNSIFAQDGTEASSESLSYKRVYILDLGLGIGFPEFVGSGNSSWRTGKGGDQTLFTSSVQLMTYTPRCDAGYGLFYYGHHSGTKKHDGLLLSDEVSEKTAFYYVAPQLSLIKRRLGFSDGIMYVNAGIGYANYKSEGSMLQKEDYRTARSALGCNMGIAYEYAFDARLGIRLAVNCIYARIKGLHKDKDSYPVGLSVTPRGDSHLFVPSLELGLSYYIVHW